MVRFTRAVAFALLICVAHAEELTEATEAELLSEVDEDLREEEQAVRGGASSLRGAARDAHPSAPQQRAEAAASYMATMYKFRANTKAHPRNSLDLSTPVCGAFGVPFPTNYEEDAADLRWATVRGVSRAHERQAHAAAVGHSDDTLAFNAARAKLVPRTHSPLLLDPARFDASKCCGGLTIDERMYDRKAFGFASPRWERSPYAPLWSKIPQAPAPPTVHFGALAHVESKWLTPSFVATSRSAAACITMTSNHPGQSKDAATQQRWKSEARPGAAKWDLAVLTPTEWYRALPGWDAGRNWVVFDNFRCVCLSSPASHSFTPLLTRCVLYTCVSLLSPLIPSETTTGGVAMTSTDRIGSRTMRRRRSFYRTTRWCRNHRCIAAPTDLSTMCRFPSCRTSPARHGSPKGRRCVTICSLATGILSLTRR